MNTSENAKFFILELLNGAIPTPLPPMSEAMITQVTGDIMITEITSDTMITEG